MSTSSCRCGSLWEKCCPRSPCFSSGSSCCSRRQSRDKSPCFSVSLPPSRVRPDGANHRIAYSMSIWCCCCLNFFYKISKSKKILSSSSSSWRLLRHPFLAWAATGDLWRLFHFDCFLMSSLIYRNLHQFHTFLGDLLQNWLEFCLKIVFWIDSWNFSIWPKYEVFSPRLTIFCFAGARFSGKPSSSTDWITTFLFPLLNISLEWLWSWL